MRTSRRSHERAARTRRPLARPARHAKFYIGSGGPAAAHAAASKQRTGRVSAPASPPPPIPYRWLRREALRGERGRNPTYPAAGTFLPPPTSVVVHEQFVCGLPVGGHVGQPRRRPGAVLHGIVSVAVSQPRAAAASRARRPPHCAASAARSCCRAALFLQ